MQVYCQFLQVTYQVVDLPAAMIFANQVTASQFISQSPLPAYTNDVRMVLTPELSVWQKLYLAQLDDYEESPEIAQIREHYQRLSDNHLWQIIGYELAHWSELFVDDFADYGTSIWFEEGMVEYISRRYFLTSAEFEAEKTINQLLVQLFQNKYGWHSLNDFGQATYDGNLASIFYEYWRSFLVIEQLVTELGSTEAVFQAYHNWLATASHIPLLDWFQAKGVCRHQI